VTFGNREFMRALTGWIFVGLLWVGIGAIVWLDQPKTAQATANTAQERQTRALEEIASELEKLRQCECR
jgi:hypothetical protein